MQSRRLLLPVAVSLACALTLVACGRSEGGPDDATTSVQPTVIDDEPATGTVEVWAMGTEGELLPELAESFKADNPDVTIEVTAIPWDEVAQKIQTAIAGGQTPDLVMTDRDFLPTYVATGGLAPVPEGLVDESDFYGGAWEGTVVDASSYAVPWYVETRALYYRTDLAAEAGWDSAPTTWEELRQFSEDLHESGVEVPLALPMGENYSWIKTLPYFWQAGGQVTNEDGTAFELDSPAMVDALTYINDYFDSGLADPNMSVDDIQAMFVDGRLGAFTSGPWTISSLSDAGGDGFLDESVGIAELPAGPAGETTGYIGGGSWSVFTDAQNPEAAWKFVRWMSDVETQKLWFDVSNDLPAVQSAWDHPPLAEDRLISVIGEQLANTEGAPLISTWVEIGVSLDAATEQMVQGVITPEEAAAQMQSEAESIGFGD